MFGRDISVDLRVESIISVALHEGWPVKKFKPPGLGEEEQGLSSLAAQIKMTVVSRLLPGSLYAIVRVELREL